jgi:hypothetical protein
VGKEKLIERARCVHWKARRMSIAIHPEGEFRLFKVNILSCVFATASLKERIFNDLLNHLHIVGIVAPGQHLLL